MREEYKTAFCQFLLRLIISAVLADTDISVKPKYRPIYRSISTFYTITLFVVASVRVVTDMPQ